MSTGLRSRKKERTRCEIVRVARQRFTERGYDGTTIADIADGADIATSTVFGYFATKDEILFSHHAVVIPDARAWLEDRAGTKPTCELVRDYLVCRLPEVLPDEMKWLRTLRQIVDAHPHLAAREHVHLRQYHDLFAESIARDMGCSADELRCQLLAGATLAGYFEAGRSVLGGTSESGQAYGLVVAFLTAGTRALYG